MSSRSYLTLAAAILVAGATACSRSQPQPKQALSQPAAQPSARDLLPEAARNALDAGNEAFRAKDYAKALKSYQDAAKAAPENASAFYGIYMVAQKTGDTKLAEQASKEIAARTAQAPMLTDSAMRAVHAPKDKGAE